jgi:hypothetical protein
MVYRFALAVAVITRMVRPVIGYAHGLGISGRWECGRRVKTGSRGSYKPGAAAVRAGRMEHSVEKDVSGVELEVRYLGVEVC